VNAIGEVVYQFPSDLEREARFAHTSRAGEGKQADVWTQEQSVESLHLVLTANQRRKRDREGMRDKLGCVIWRWLRKDDDVVLHRLSLSSCPGKGFNCLLLTEAIDLAETYYVGYQETLQE